MEYSKKNEKLQVLKNKRETQQNVKALRPHQ